MKRPVATILIFGSVLFCLTVLQAGLVSGANPFFVIPVNSCHDPNLTADNICLGVTICGVAGTKACSQESYSTVTSEGQVWMDRNLGASRVATSLTDSAAYGDLYQWGRGADGHEKRTSATTTTLSTRDNPGHARFILPFSAPYDWRSPQNNTLWQGVSGTNNPCPAGFRLPTDVEWRKEFDSWSSNNAAGAFASPLKLVAAGYRYRYDGTLNDVGSDGYYWSSTVAGTYSSRLLFGATDADASPVGMYRASGLTVRCLKD